MYVEVLACSSCQGVAAHQALVIRVTCKRFFTHSKREVSHVSDGEEVVLKR